MQGVNKVFVLGNLGADPEVRHSSNGVSITTMSVATKESWKDQSGQKQEKTEWHKIVLFKRLGEIAAQYLKKGSKVFVEGSLRTDKWTDGNGVERHATKIIASSIQLLDSKDNSFKESNNDSGYNKSPVNDVDDFSEFDDIPF